MVTKATTAAYLPAIDFAERLNATLDLDPYFPKKHKGRQAAVAKLFQVSGTAAYKWLSGKNLPEQQLMREFELKLRVNSVWLWTGRGSPSLETPEAHSSGTSFAVPEALKIIARAFANGELDARDLEILRQIADRLKKPAAAVPDLPYLNDEQARLDDLYRRAQAVEPAQLMNLAKKLQNEARLRARAIEGGGKHHDREAGTG